MASELSNHYKFQKMSGNIDWDANSFKAILMDTGFVFDKDAHATYANVSASELATGFGYTQNTKVLANVSVAESDVNDAAEMTCDPVVWTASGGDIGPSPGMIIFDDTTSDDTIVGYIDFGSDQTASDGGTFTVSSIQVDEA